MRRSVPWSLVNLEGSDIGLDRYSREQVSVGQDDFCDPDPLTLALLLVLAQAGLRHPRLAGDLDASLEHPVGVARRAGHVLVVGMHPELAPCRLDDRPGQPVMV